MSSFPFSFLCKTVFNVVDGNFASLRDDGVWMVEKELNKTFVINHFTDSDKTLVLDNGCFSLVLNYCHQVGYCNMVDLLHLCKDETHLMLQKGSAFFEILRQKSLANCDA